MRKEKEINMNSLHKRIEELEKYLIELELFEAEILIDDECWTDNGLLVLGQKYVDKILELQEKRNDLLGQ